MARLHFTVVVKKENTKYNVFFHEHLVFEGVTRDVVDRYLEVLTHQREYTFDVKEI